jgi:hypothetical protein
MVQFHCTFIMKGSGMYTVNGISLALFLQLNTLPPGSRYTAVKFKGERSVVWLAKWLQPLSIQDGEQLLYNNLHLIIESLCSCGFTI